jgi:predicted nucleic acid-binding protein
VTALPRPATTSYVFDEVVTFFNSRGAHAKAVQVGNNLLQSPSVQLMHVAAALSYEGWTYFQGHHDKDYSLTDCISFLVMRKLGIRTAFALDRYFVQGGFTKEP